MLRTGGGALYSYDVHSKLLAVNVEKPENKVMLPKYINFQNFRRFNFRRFNFRTKIFGRNYHRFRTISDKITDIFKQVNEISDIYDLIMSRQIIHQM